MNYHQTQSTDTLAPGTLKNYFTKQKYLEKFLATCSEVDVVLKDMSQYYLVGNLTIWENTEK